MTVTYLGIAFQVVHEDTTSVTLHRVDSNTHDNDFVVMKDSPRYEAMFRKPKLSFASLIAEAKKEADIITAPNTKVHDFVERYAIDATAYESSQEALEALKQDISQDSTGVIRFIATTFAYRNNVVFSQAQWSEMFVDNIDFNVTHSRYTKELLDAYLDAIDSPSPTTVKAVSKLIPQEFRDECINAILCFNFGANSDWIVSPKQVQSLLREV